MDELRAAAGCSLARAGLPRCARGWPPGVRDTVPARTSVCRGRLPARRIGRARRRRTAARAGRDPLPPFSRRCAASVRHPETGRRVRRHIVTCCVCHSPGPVSFAAIVAASRPGASRGARKRCPTFWRPRRRRAQVGRAATARCVARSPRCSPSAASVDPITVASPRLPAGIV